ncbi:MAG: DUF4114 domain-containing protein [Comamonadaceae bacterium]
MIWNPVTTISPAFDLSFLADISLSITRIDSLTAVRSSFAIARPEDEAETLQRLLTDGQPASLDSLTSSKIFSQDSDINWRSTEGHAIGGSRGTQINGAGTYIPLIFAGNQQFPNSESIVEAVAIGNTIKIKTSQGLQYQLAQQGTGVLNVSDSADQFAITIKRLGRNQNSFALYQVNSETGSIMLNGQTFSPVQPGYAKAALESAATSQLVFNTGAMPEYDEEITLRDIVLSPGAEYGILFFNDTRSTTYSSFAAANPDYAVQVQSYLPNKDGQLVFALEDISISDPTCDRDYNDLIVTIEAEPVTNFEQLTVFGDSMSDFGSRSAVQKKQLLSKPDLVPAWSGSTYSDAQSIWQTELRTALHIPYDSVTGAGITNSFVGGSLSPIPAAPENPSYASDGALSGRNSLYDVYASLNPPQFPPALLGHPYSVSGIGVQSQIIQALTVDNKSLANNLVALWSGIDDFPAAIKLGQTLNAFVQDVLSKTRANLITLLRSSETRSVLISTLAPLQGNVDGVVYSMPYLKTLPPEFTGTVEAGTVLRAAIASMVVEVNAMFPYAALVDFNNEYEFNWNRFGGELGNFSDYGITQTTETAQSNKATNANEYLYFDLNGVHPTESGHKMIGKAIELTLAAEKSSLDAACLNDTFAAEGPAASGSWRNDSITAAQGGSELNGLDGNDFLTGLNGSDTLNGGNGNDLLCGGGGINVLNGGLGADVFDITKDSLAGGLQTIKDFNAIEGDRLLLSEAYAEAIGDFFFVPTQADWQKAVTFESTAQGGLLNVHFTDPTKVDGLIALNGLTSFNTAWIS